MKIAMVSEHANPLACLGGVDAGGQNVHVDNLAAALSRRGHRVTVFTRRDRITMPRRQTSPSGYQVELIDAGPAAPIPKDDLWPHMPAFAHELRSRLAARRYDVVHSHFWMSGAAALMATPGLGLPVVHTFHALGSVKHRHQGDDDTSPADRIQTERDICERADAIIATCRDEVGELTSLGADPLRISTVPCGVDTARFRPTAATTGRRLLVAGRLVARKGVGDVITALAGIPDCSLTIAGGPPAAVLDDDPEVQALRTAAEAMGVADRVTFTGGVPPHQIARLMNDATVVVAVPWYEPFGIVPLEAMACGRPVVGSAVGGLLDTVLPGVTGELVPPQRPDLLAPVLADLLDRPALGMAYGLAGRRRVVRRFRWQHVAARTEQAYADVLSGARIAVAAS